MDARDGTTWGAREGGSEAHKNITLLRTHYQAPPSVLPTHAMSAPFVARARLHVIGSTCRFAGVMPAPKPHSDRPGFDRLDRLNHVCRLTSDAAHLLVGAAAVTFSLRCVRASCLPPLRSCPGHVSSRSEAPWHASADAHSSCVPSATVCLLAWLTWTNVVSRARQL